MSGNGCIKNYIRMRCTRDCASKIHSSIYSNNLYYSAANTNSKTYRVQRICGVQDFQQMSNFIHQIINNLSTKLFSVQSDYIEIPNT